MSVYLDHNASTPLDPEVLEEMLPFLSRSFGNASSLHRSGRFQRSAIETARQRVANLVNTSPENIIFTSGGTEANNLAIKGVLPMGSETTVMTSEMEHASVLQPVDQAGQAGCEIHLLPATTAGLIDVSASEQQIHQVQPDMVTIQLANNETGVIQPLEQLSRFIHAQSDAIVHSDVTQAIGKINVDIQQMDVDMMTLSGHKFQGPQGVGALIIKGRNIKTPLLSGGPQESAKRAGTENVAMLVGLGKAAELARIKWREKQAYLLELRHYFEQQLKRISGVQIFGEESERLPNTSFFSIPYYHGQTLLMQLDQAGFELASGSACHSEVTRPSHVLSAMGIDEDLALNAVRASFGMENTRQQIDQLIETLNALINRLPSVLRQVAG